MLKRPAARRISLLMLCCATVASAQTPLGTAFTYQGQLRKSGLPVTSTADFQFTLWDALEAGNPVGTTVAIDGKSVVNGLFTVTLDFGAAAFTGDARWLEVAVRAPAGEGDFTTLSPRHEVNAAPHATYARSSGSIPYGITGNGSTDAVPKFISPTGIGNSALIESAGNVGIGTITPGFPLSFADVLGDKIALYGQSGNSYGFGIQPSLLQIHSNTSSADIAFGSGSSASLNETMRIKGTGNVGIGINAPATRLHTRGPSNLLRVESTTGSAGIQIASEGTGLVEVRSPVGTDEMRFWVNGADRMTIGTDGRVGIGTAPEGTSQLVVSGTGFAVAARATDSAGRGLYAESDYIAVEAHGDSYGVHAQAWPASGHEGIGVNGVVNTSTSNTRNGVRGYAAGPGVNHGVHGEAYGSGVGTHIGV